MAERVPYRKLPGHRRGLFRGASVWMGPDHLLLVRSMRFREEYKRYQFRDIQAIVVAEAKRFHVSTRAIGIGCLWFMTALFVRNLGSWGPALVWSSALLLLAVWAIVSAYFSCRCRIFTAVSRDDLPSLYRTWTARRFLREVEPRIAAVQGTVRNWGEEMEQRDIGPAEYRPVTTGVAPPPKPVQPRRVRTLASDFLILCLFTDAVWNSMSAKAPPWLVNAGQSLALVVTLAAILVVVQHYRGTLASGMQRVAIGTLVAIGLMYYLRPMVVSMVVGATGGPRQPVSTATLLAAAPWMRTAEAVVTALLGCTGVGVMIFGEKEQ